ncbi:MAG: dephospho-CoA kinase [Proteobacteria bacterium]|nr:dephospho-CoA kinase [Pseudomonadota bacterium]
MIVVGLTGSIGMGKSTAADLLRRLGVPVYDADAAVHRLLARGGRAVPAIATRFKDVVRDGAVDRPALGRIVFADPAALKALEAIVHPLVYEAQRRFLRAQAQRRARVVVLDIPLLFEGGGVRRCAATMVVSAPALVQRQRVLRRPGMTAAKLAGILAQQMPDAEKRRRADVVVPTGLGKRLTWRRLRAALPALARARQPTLALWAGRPGPVKQDARTK